MDEDDEKTNSKSINNNNNVAEMIAEEEEEDPDDDFIFPSSAFVVPPPAAAATVHEEERPCPVLNLLTESSLHNLQLHLSMRSWISLILANDAHVTQREEERGITNPFASFSSSSSSSSSVLQQQQPYQQQQRHDQGEEKEENNGDDDDNGDCNDDVNVSANDDGEMILRASSFMGDDGGIVDLWPITPEQLRRFSSQVETRMNLTAQSSERDLQDNIERLHERIQEGLLRVRHLEEEEARRRQQQEAELAQQQARYDEAIRITRDNLLFLERIVTLMELYFRVVNPFPQDRHDLLRVATTMEQFETLAGRIDERINGCEARVDQLVHVEDRSCGFISCCCLWFCCVPWFRYEDETIGSSESESHSESESESEPDDEESDLEGEQHDEEDNDDEYCTASGDCSGESDDGGGGFGTIVVVVVM